MGNQWRSADGTGLSDDLPDMNAGPWDPDPHWQRVLDLTEADRIEEALFDEVIYLKSSTPSSIIWTRSSSSSRPFLRR